MNDMGVDEIYEAGEGIQGEMERRWAAKDTKFYLDKTLALNIDTKSYELE